MKDLKDSELKKIAYNCRKATFLIEKKQIGEITLLEKMELKIHLAGCLVCRTFEQQSITINRMVKELFNVSGENKIELDEEFKKDLQDRIEKRLEK